MPSVTRTSGNYRSYGDNARQQLQFIRRCRDLGFTLDQVRDLLRLSSDKTMPCAEVKEIAAQHRRAVAVKLKDLQFLLRELRRLTTCCHGKCAIAECRIIGTLSTKRENRENVPTKTRRKP